MGVFQRVLEYLGVEYEPDEGGTLPPPPADLDERVAVIIPSFGLDEAEYLAETVAKTYLQLAEHLLENHWTSA